jgi:hypothetical protein
MHATRTFEFHSLTRLYICDMTKTRAYMPCIICFHIHGHQAIIYSFAVTLSIKLRLLLSAEGAMEQELVMCSKAMHEHEHQYMVSKLSGSTPESMQATGGGRPKQTDIRRSTNQRIFTMINTPTGRPKRFTYAIFMIFESKIL